MFQPTQYQEHDLETLQQFISTHNFATLMSYNSTHEQIEADHLPFLLDTKQGTYGTLSAHIAKANPLYKNIQQNQSVLLSFQGDQQYISPNWYPSKQDHHRAVPTWNYMVVHVRGRLRCIDDEKSLLALLGRLTRQHEASQNTPWKMKDAPADYINALLKDIAIIYIEIDSIVGQFKTSQDRPNTDKVKVAEALKTTAPEMSAHIKQHTD
ncbi:FMN-binding negative transcriptional regulator [Acinetobacter rathckeae]|uniref:FMN-binding negative transcriptional regulator n=1 Tax=Acinetobacter rathckeae TaxID=2605272 RepID=UPI0018A25697|nr:FMN-binding negative transcriptional regulator [Acinetobacter rathckeae]MBF7687420.1 FMN-binding negative transcriptional regulator [Acinetobacter rathckeae]MBF7694821.1 FMN-binding negative transcriptional regulator [Acinetobacter rathckeae]